MYKHILIATDGSELASRGVEQGLSLAAPLGARVTVLTVVEPLDPNTVRSPSPPACVTLSPATSSPSRDR